MSKKQREAELIKRYNQYIRTYYCFCFHNWIRSIEGIAAITKKEPVVLHKIRYH